MRKLYAVDISDGARLATLRDLLNNASIPAVLKNDQLSSVWGGIPFTEASPELWVINDEDFARAKLLVSEWLSSDDNEPDRMPWACASCGERIEPQFNHCWNCGSSR